LHSWPLLRATGRVARDETSSTVVHDLRTTAGPVIYSLGWT